ncbi:MAG: hypothetical protein K2M17_04415 [Bacilli bacterium]|nr:hypothetical protein [Bacilli bacterium]
MKSLSHIKCTKTEPVFRKEGEIRNIFVNTFNQAFPPKVEEQYVALTNRICDYFATCYTMEEYDKQLYFQALYLQKEYSKLEKSESFESIRSRLNDAIKNANENPTPEAYKTVSDIANLARKMLEKRTNAKSEIESLNNTRYEHEKSIATEKGELEKIIADISATLQAIASLNVDGERRINRLYINQKHFNVIDELAITPLEKDTLKRQFISYFNMRCVAFKYVEELAEKILAAYSKREVLHRNADNGKMDKDLELCIIALEILYAFPNCNRRIGTIKSSLCDFINADCEMIDIITRYLHDGTFNEQEYLDACNSATLDVNIRSFAIETKLAIKRHQSTALQRL